MNFSIFTIILLLSLSMVSAHQQLSPPPVPGFMCGVSGSAADLATDKLLQQSLHVTHVRRYIMWQYAQPSVSNATFEYDLTVDKVKSNPKKYVYDWSNNASEVNWGGLDYQISTMCSRLKAVTGKPIVPILEVFEGTTDGLPRFKEDSIKFVDPCTVGTEAYLAHTYRWVRAVTHRYTKLLQETCGTQNPIFQIENEFNEAGLSVVYGQRTFCLQWFNWTFLTQSLSTLRQAVKDESGGEQNSPVLVTQNLHTDVPAFVHDLINLKGFYVQAAQDWNSLVDIWALDAYPNMIIASPMRAYKIQERIANVTFVTNGTKKVFIMETGFPRLDAHASPLPPASPSNWSVLDFSAAKQALYSEQAIESVLAARGAGICFFTVDRSAGMEPPQGGYLNEDLELFVEIQTLLQTHNMTQFIDWVLAPFTDHLTALLERAGIYLHRPDSQHGWALLDQNGNPVPAFDSIAKKYKELCG